MKKIIIPLSLCFSLLNYAGTVSAGETCYDVDGDIQTVNTSPSTQFGTIALDLVEQESGELVQIEGFINGTITGGDGLTYVELSHTMIGNESGSNSDVNFTIITINDIAEIGYSETLQNPAGPVECYIPVKAETVSNFIPVISKISRAKITSINVTFKGWLNNGAPACASYPNEFIVDTLKEENTICMNTKIK